MNNITRPSVREIVDDFAKAIEETKREAAPPNKIVIDFRDESKKKKERPVYTVPIDLLRYRKDNGRISSDVLDYEKNIAILDEKSREAQKLIRGFLERKDREKTEELKNSILHKGQQDPAIITCDGFLINGNRRKMVIEILNESSEHKGKFPFMDVVILPGKKAEGGPPTLKEIEQIENRYQLQSTGKAEYYGFDRALSMRRKVKLGMSLEEQLRDDPAYAILSEKEFGKAMKKIEEEYLGPLDCIDRYLSYLGREGLYGTISTGMADPGGRWQAFIDYYMNVYKKLENEKERIKLGICEDEVGKIEDIAFKIIIKRELKNLPKLHKVMRDLPKLIKNKDSKKELYMLSKIKLQLDKEECSDEKGKEYDEREIDLIWAKKNEREINWHLKKAFDFNEREKEEEAPLSLLQAALNKLNHKNMTSEPLTAEDLHEARSLAFKIKKRADDLESEFFNLEKNIKKGIDEIIKKHKK